MQVATTIRFLVILGYLSCVGAFADLTTNPTSEPKIATEVAPRSAKQDDLLVSFCKYLINNGYYLEFAKYMKGLCADLIEPKCHKSRPLGIGNGDIHESQITASDFFESLYLPGHGRLHYKGHRGKRPAWEPVLPRKGEWIQVDLGKKTIVTGVATQGSGVGSVAEWVTEYILQYSDDGNTFKDYENGKRFNANWDRNTVVKNNIYPPIQSRYIRLVPTKWNEWNALRMELYGVTQDGCGALGMQNGAIPDSSIIASSYYHTRYLTRRFVNFSNKNKTRLNPGAWYIQRGSSKVGQWLQVDLKSVFIINGIATQGSPKPIDCYVKTYSLKYSNDSNDFVDYFGGKLLNGNRDKYTIVRHDLVPPIHARYLRIYPKTWHACISLALELYGCKEATAKKKKLNSVIFGRH